MLTPEDVKAFDNIVGTPSPGKIAKLLNEAGYKNSKGNDWTYNNIFYYYPDYPRAQDRDQAENKGLEVKIIEVVSNYKQTQDELQHKKELLKK